MFFESRTFQHAIKIVCFKYWIWIHIKQEPSTGDVSSSVLCASAVIWFWLWVFTVKNSEVKHSVNPISWDSCTHSKALHINVVEFLDKATTVKHCWDFCEQKMLTFSLQGDTWFGLPAWSRDAQHWMLLLCSLHNVHSDVQFWNWCQTLRRKGNHLESAHEQSRQPSVGLLCGQQRMMVDKLLKWLHYLTYISSIIYVWILVFFVENMQKMSDTKGTRNN